uniref:Uncharacterized protein n=1 Tax=Oryza sativa subsp. japonica TaxID=39947 RepID=Q8GVM6_ORYSJ|nr:hypothetical protein [Oryza sativa Japonica Group]
MEEKLFELADTVHKYDDARSNGNGLQQRGRRLAVVIIDGNFDADSSIEPLIGNEEVDPNKVVTVSARPK